MSWIFHTDFIEQRKNQIDRDLIQSQRLTELKCPEIVQSVFYSQKLSNKQRCALQDGSILNLFTSASKYLESIDKEYNVINEILESKDSSCEKCQRLKIVASGIEEL